MRPLTDVELEILNSIYFVEPFDKILEECSAPANIVADALKFLIDQKMVTPMRWDDKRNEYVRSFYYNGDNMHDYHYLATKEGLLAHNSR